jgi:hypothetical protein
LAVSPLSLTVIFIQGDDGVNEYEIWEGLANMYSSLSYWRDAEICLQKARALKSYSAAALHAEGTEKFFITRIYINHLVPFYRAYKLYEFRLYMSISLITCESGKQTTRSYPNMKQSICSINSLHLCYMGSSEITRVCACPGYILSIYAIWEVQR